MPTPEPDAERAELLERVRELLDERLSRGVLKRMAIALDREPALRQELIAACVRRGDRLPGELPDWGGKRLLKWARARAAQAQIRTNPIARDEGFVCVHCRREVPPHGRTARDHCPFCLHGLHVDLEVPGDRASDCGGILKPMRVDGAGESWRIHYRCQRCGVERVNRAVLDGAVADAWSEVVRLSRGS